MIVATRAHTEARAPRDPLCLAIPAPFRRIQRINEGFGQR
jgi:hypothetical protein